jgi:hypothetical protein
MICVVCGSEKQAWHVKVGGGCFRCHNNEQKFYIFEIFYALFIIVMIILIAGVLAYALDFY